MQRVEETWSGRWNHNFYINCSTSSAADGPCCNLVDVHDGLWTWWLFYRQWKPTCCTGICTFAKQLWPASPPLQLLKPSAKRRLESADRCLGLQRKGLLCFSHPRISDRGKMQPRASAITRWTPVVWRKKMGKNTVCWLDSLKKTHKKDKTPSFTCSSLTSHVNIQYNTSPSYWPRPHLGISAALCRPPVQSHVEGPTSFLSHINSFISIHFTRSL